MSLAIPSVTTKGVLGLLFLAIAAGCVFWWLRPVDAGEPPVEKSLYEFTLPDLEGKPQALRQYEGKVLLLVNTASKCGYTGQYEGLQKMFDQYKEKGLVILGFPSNDFLGQEPGTNEEIKQFCRLSYGVSFPMFGKIMVTGGDAHPLYRFLTHPATNPVSPGPITWNFNKFLVSRTGQILQRFGTRTPPEDPELQKAVLAALEETQMKPPPKEKSGKD